MKTISYDQLLDIYHAADELVKAWPHVTLLELARLVWDLRKALGYELKRNGNERKIINADTLPEKATEGLTCSLSGG